MDNVTDLTRLELIKLLKRGRDLAQQSADALELAEKRIRELEAENARLREQLGIMPRAKLAQLSAEAKAAREPLPPEDLIDAKHDHVHREHGQARAACTVRNKRREPLDAESRDKCTIERLERELADKTREHELAHRFGVKWQEAAETYEARAERYRKALHALVEDMELVLSHDGLPESDALRSARDALGEG